MKQTQIALAGAALVIVAFGGWWASGAQPSGKQLPPSTAAVSECDVSANASCRAAFPNGPAVTLSIQPRPIEAMKPLNLVVTTEGPAVEKVVVEFNGVDMDMGLNQFPLRRQEGRFEGQGMLPVCVRGAMLWEAKVTLTTAEGRFVFPFRFETRRPG